MTKEKLDEIMKRLNAATPGPWEWDVNSKCHIAKLLTTHSGRYYVMEFVRWGPQGAAPTFQVYDRYEGDVRDRGSQGMVRADKLLKSMPGREHHVGYDDYIDHPDAELIAHAYQDIQELLEYIDKLEADLEAKECSAANQGADNGQY